MIKEIESRNVDLSKEIMFLKKRNAEQEESIKDICQENQSLSNLNKEKQDVIQNAFYKVEEYKDVKMKLEKELANAKKNFTELNFIRFAINCV